VLMVQWMAVVDWQAMTQSRCAAGAYAWNRTPMDWRCCWHLAAGWTEGLIERRKEGASNEIEGQRGGGGEDGRIQGSCFSDPR